MANSFWRWKDANCNGKNIEWVEMTASEFKQFVRTKEGYGRYFIRLGNEVCREADIIFIEATYEQYHDWYTEMQHHFYLRHINPGYQETSIDYFDSDQNMSLHEMIPAFGLSPEEVAERTDLINYLWMAISTLNEPRRDAILAKYFWYPSKNDEEISKLLGEDFASFTKRKYRALRQLENFLRSECPIS